MDRKEMVQEIIGDWDLNRLDKLDAGAFKQFIALLEDAEDIISGYYEQAENEN